MKPKYLVADTAAFVKNVPLWECGEEVFSIKEVISEIRDRQARDCLNALPIPITLRQPQPCSIKFVNEFSKKTGDYASLSLADIKVLALTYELEVEARGDSTHLHLEPQKIVTEWAGKTRNQQDPTDSTENLEQENYGTSSCEQRMSNVKEDDPLNFTLRNHAETKENSIAAIISHKHLKELDSFLSDHSYASGHVPTAADMIIRKVILQDYPQFDSMNQSLSGKTDENHTPSISLAASFPHLQRWATHLSSFTKEELALLPSSSPILAEFLQRFPDRDSVEKKEECLHSNTVGETVDTKCEPDEKNESNLPNHDEGVECDRDDTNEEEQHREDVAEEENNEKTDAKSPVEDSDNESNDESADEGWITPSNIKRHKIKSKINPQDEEEEEDALVACITSDFAMQNVLKHIGLSVMGVDGKLIRHIKTFILRCHACYKTTSIMTKLFCPHCGNKTLKKVSVTVNRDGSQHIWINTKRPISTRGMKYSLPAPKGGKHGRNPLLVADQREAKQFSSKMSRKKVNPLHQDYDPDHLPFAVRDVFSRAAQLGYIGGKDHHHYYWEKRNPNEAQHRTGKKKK